MCTAHAREKERVEANMNDHEDAEECVEKYQNRFSWLKDSKFIQDLENDSVDSELLDEELSALQEEEILTSRQKLVKCLQSNPVQILLCVVVLLDAGIVIAQILLDLHSVREKLHRREQDISQLLAHIRAEHPEAFQSYEGSDVNFILEILSRLDNLTDSIRDKDSNKNRRRRHGSRHSVDNARNRTGSISMQQQISSYMQEHSSNDRGTGVSVSSGIDSGHGANNIGDLRNIGGGGGGGNSDRGGGGAAAAAERAPAPAHSKHNSRERGHDEYMQEDTVRLRRDKDKVERNISHQADCPKCVKKVFHKSPNPYVGPEEHDTLHEVAHGLHFASISLLGFLVIEDLVKILAMGKDFFKHKIEIFDAIIITSSFAFDIIFLGGVTGEEGEKAAAVLVVLLLWRITRVIDGILITAKQRQEFRIRLQKRARRKAEKRIDLLEDEKHTRIRQITALKELCTKAGVNEDDIDSCTPKRPRRVSNTLCALSSVARLSVSMTMSMSSGLFSMAEEDSEKSDENKDSHSKYDKFLDPGGPSEEGFALELYKPERRHSLPVPGKMSDIEEESRSSMQEEDSDSPVNACGVRIIIEDEPSDSQSTDEAETVQETLLETGDGAIANDRRISQFSEVHLLA